MGTESPLAVVLRRKWIVIATVALVVGAAAIFSVSLEKVYSTSSRLLVTLPSDTQSFDTVQASQAIARSYSEVIDSPNIGDRVAQRLGTAKQAVQGVTSFELIPETQLLKITAENPDPARAQQIANTYAQVFISYGRSDLGRTTKASITLADAAPLPTTPARPRPTLYVMVAGLLAIALGVALAFLRERMDRRLRSSEEVESAFDVPVLARVPRRGRSDASSTAFFEAHHILRTNLQFARGTQRLRSIAITSGRQGEGKTMTAAAIARVSAEVGARVIAVEGDLRRPSLQRSLMPEEREPLTPGLSNYLIESVALDEAIHPTGLANIDIVPPGPLPPSPGALFESRRAQTLIEELGGEADLVLVDCPPLTIGADASIVAGWVDGVIVVVDLQTSTDRSVRQAIRQVQAVQAPLLGLVVNRDREATPGRYAYGEYARPARDPGRLRRLASSGRRAGP
jgi:polysaccharide biosynthesis transport protein